jgi:hypothetical protein
MKVNKSHTSGKPGNAAGNMLLSLLVFFFFATFSQQGLNIALYYGGKSGWFSIIFWHKIVLMELKMNLEII